MYSEGMLPSLRHKTRAMSAPKRLNLDEMKSLCTQCRSYDSTYPIGQLLISNPEGGEFWVDTWPDTHVVLFKIQLSEKWMYVVISLLSGRTGSASLARHASQRLSSFVCCNIKRVPFIDDKGQLDKNFCRHLELFLSNEDVLDWKRYTIIDYLEERLWCGELSSTMTKMNKLLHYTEKGCRLTYTVLPDVLRKKLNGFYPTKPSAAQVDSSFAEWKKVWRPFEEEVLAKHLAVLLLDDQGLSRGMAVANSAADCILLVNEAEASEEPSESELIRALVLALAQLLCKNGVSPKFSARENSERNLLLKEGFLCTHSKTTRVYYLPHTEGSGRVRRSSSGRSRSSSTASTSSTARKASWDGQSSKARATSSSGTD